MFLIEALQTLGDSYAFYLSFTLGFLLSLPIAAVRSYQVLYRKKLKGVASVSAEVAVELLRIVQYVLFIAYGTRTSYGSLFSAETWKTMLAGIGRLEWGAFWWDLLGFIIVFGAYNAVLFAILRPSVVQKMMDKAGIRRFEEPNVRNAVMLAFKNLFLIPVSMIYLFDILNIF
jgi:hypothetical protein